MHVCDNVGEHLIGNVYARYEWEEEAQRAVDALNDRWYNGEWVVGTLWSFDGTLTAHAVKSPPPTQGGHCLQSCRPSQTLGKPAVDSMRPMSASGEGFATSCTSGHPILASYVR